MKKILLILLVVCFMAPVYSQTIMFKRLDGTRVTYPELVSSSNTVLFIWATWCPHCLKQMEKLVAEEPFIKDVNILYINTGESRQVVERFADSLDLKSNIRRKVILDIRSKIARKFSVAAIPTFIFLKDGKVIHRSYYLDNELFKEVFPVK